MEERQGYDVLKIVVHSDRCYMSADYVRGKPLIIWLKYHPRIAKAQLYRWIRGLLEELGHFHQCRGNPCYQYLNPYSIIVGEDEKLYLLDLGSRQQDEMLHLMQRRYVRENFLSPDNQYYQKASVREDIYGFGKTIQYLLSVVGVEPALGKLEEIRFQKIISRCLNQNSRKNYQTIQEISEHFPNEKKTRKNKIPLVRKILACAAVFIIGIVAIGSQIVEGNSFNQEKKGESISGGLSDTENNSNQILEDYREEIRQKQEQWNEEKQEIVETSHEREKELVYELALLYFIELGDYQKSQEALESMETPEDFSKDFASLCALLDGESQSATDQEVEELLERLEKEVPDAEDERYAACIAKGYQMLNGEEESEGDNPEEAEASGDGEMQSDQEIIE